MGHHHGVVARARRRIEGAGVSQIRRAEEEAIIDFVGQQPQIVAAGEIEQPSLFVFGG